MKRNVDLKEISDGKLYTADDMVRADCHDCQGCSACCSGMGDSVILDPMDVWRLRRGTGMEFAELVEKGYVELGIADGMILPPFPATCLISEALVFQDSGTEPELSAPSP